MNLQDRGLLWYLRNVIQHQVHAADGALKAKAPAGAGQHRQTPAGQEEASGPAEESGLHCSIRGWTGKATDVTEAAVAAIAVLVEIVGAGLNQAWEQWLKAAPREKAPPGQSRGREITLQG